MRLSKKYSSAAGGRIKFLKTLISLILRSKINEISVLKNILWRRKPPKDIRGSRSKRRIC
jgi:hypothetical protein